VVFSSVAFLYYFLPVFLITYFIFRKNLVILLFSLLFYGWGEPRFLPILFFYIVINYAVGLAIGRTRSRHAWILVGVIGNLSLLVYFKYLDFLSSQLSMIAARLGFGALPIAHVPLPLGISFITFQGLSYVIDVYRGTVPPQRSLVDFAMYKSMFPQLIAGPIVRYVEIAPDIAHRAVLVDDLAEGTRQFIVGLGQKVLIANVLGAPADQIFALSAAERGTLTAWLGIICYTLQIYFDFAGYSNMAIGLGRLIGFRYPINFYRPYVAQSVTDFWRRWHMTLSRWFRDYLYIPLGGNRGAPWRTYLNLLTVFALCGFWHGANWPFLIWGLYHGAFLILERSGFSAVLQRLWRPFRHAYLLLMVTVGWVFFRADTLKAALSFLRAMFGDVAGSPLTPVGRYLTTETAIVLCAAMVLAVAPFTVAVNERDPVRPAMMVHIRNTARDVVLLLILFASLLEVAGGAYNPFIYYRF